MTSHDVVLHVRKITGQKRVGHAGTLDPMATGVLILCLGQATRVAEYLISNNKVYRARIRLGISTDTYDADGQITHQAEVTGITRAQVQSALDSFVGILEQTPPMYSAIKHKGTPLYRLARRGQVVPRQARKVEIQSIKLTAWAPPELEIEVHCSKGTYIRSLAHDLGLRLGCGAHLTALTRLASGRFNIEQAITLQELEQALTQGNIDDLLQPLDAALQDFPAVVVDHTTANKICHGQRITLPEPLEASMCRAYSSEGHLLALLRHEDDKSWRPHKVFKPATS